MRKWNGYVCGVGFCCLVAGSALLGVGLTPPTKFKVDPKCDDEVQECERYVTEYDRNNVYYCKIFGIILFTIGVILSAIDLGSCICQFYKGNFGEDLDDRSWHDRVERLEEPRIGGPEADRFLEISTRRREAARNHRTMHTNDSEEEEERRPIYSRGQEPNLNWRQSNREPSLAERSNMRSEAARNNYPRPSSTSPRTSQTTRPNAPPFSYPSAPPSHPSTSPSAPVSPPVTSSTRGSSNRQDQPPRYNDQPPGYDQLLHPPTYWEALEQQGHFEDNDIEESMTQNNEDRRSPGGNNETSV